MKMSTRIGSVATQQDPPADAGPEIHRGTSKRDRRLHLWAPVRYLVILLMGACVGLLASYALRQAGM